MKISKYIHSCLLLEKDGFQLLFDPGKFTFAEDLVKVEQFIKVNAVIITHSHPDHLHVEQLKAIVKLSGAKIYTNKEVAKELKESGLSYNLVEAGLFDIGPFALQAINVKHENILDSPLPDMQAYLIDGRVLNPADSFGTYDDEFQQPELLILPVMAPFTTEIAVAEFADHIKPKAVLPVHDGYAKEFFLKQRYETYSKHFEKRGIVFHQAMQPGFSISI
ncbi:MULTISPECIES: MBL fold metallo-hydrolase [Mucilaginibacter]|uniref:MBL fold metallo-hydrolase n=2 Tax=Mucilaginibacter TaxID=423349 RepID=A0A6I4ICR1_9SPHI|nr:MULTISPECIES: MBL fold metallo-hydrolase [Mucilaginibacter]MDT3401129.1 L-ascorbate metabolism protein UlaG (beta-lactamase superfamily) [Mucilaginibacter terrae]MVN91386.1 MBL fold metallo-hydrolase [Mucilaginibacter aquatilis]